MSTGQEGARRGGNGTERYIYELQQCALCRQNFGLAHPCLGMEDLPLKIRQVDSVGIEDAQLT